MAQTRDIHGKDVDPAACRVEGRHEMINISKDSVFNLHPIDVESVRGEVASLLIHGEIVVAAFRTVRDQLVFTNKRIITIDVQGMTGARKSYTTLPYSKIQFYTIQTPGLVELVSDSELFLMFSNGFTATFEIRGRCNIVEIGQMISEYVL
jgi:hypothetical protein